ncbi:AcrR family transcriptional regulator [Rhodoplanes tepidamans]|nr:AcrR family transcriptional regulator [Rhodoplanes tepidamans]
MSTAMPQTRPRRRGETRERLLAVAEEAILAKGFAATSIDELIAATGLTKSGFFYHFKDKGELAKALLRRYLDRDEEILDGLFARADALSDDPLHGYLIFLKLFAEMLADLPGAHPGCLAASYCYQEQLFDQEIRDLNRAGVLAWRAASGPGSTASPNGIRRGCRPTSTWSPTWPRPWWKAASCCRSCCAIPPCCLARSSPTGTMCGSCSEPPEGRRPPTGGIGILPLPKRYATGPFR